MLINNSKADNYTDFQQDARGQSLKVTGIV